MHRFVLRYGVTLSSSSHLFCLFVLVFHLQQKHEEGQRLLHYLQQTNTALATGTFIYVINKLHVDTNVYNHEIPLKVTNLFRKV